MCGILTVSFTRKLLIFHKDTKHYFPFIFATHFTLLLRLPDCLHSDKKVVDDKHFLQNSNELLIRNATIALSGYYSCVIEFVSSGAKIQTPNELIKIGEYERMYMNHDQCNRGVTRGTKG